MKVVKQIGNVQTNQSDRPIADIKILRARAISGEDNESS